jgi:hypothetical protein
MLVCSLNEAVVATVLPHILKKTKRKAAIQPILRDFLHKIYKKRIGTKRTHPSSVQDVDVETRAKVSRQGKKKKRTYSYSVMHIS